MCCRQPVYEFHERKITNKLIDDLENSGLIRDCEESWVSLLLLAVKPHQKSCEDMHVFIWRLGVNYRALNNITLVFEFPIYRCADNIEDLGDS